MIWETNDEILLKLAERIKKIRKIRKMTQMDLSKTSNVSYGSIKRFEQTGEISLSGLLQVADALGVKDEISNLFTGSYYRDISEVLNG